jgi:hypothetical protein
VVPPSSACWSEAGRLEIVAGTEPLDDAAILRRYGIEPDPVIEAYKKEIDRTLLRENLRRTPEERLQRLMALQLLAEECRREGSEPTHAELQELLAERERGRGG